MRHRYLLLVPLLSTALSYVACAHQTALSPEEARTKVEQLMALYRDDRIKFVGQKQRLQDLKDCSEADALAQAAKKWEDEANMQPGNTQDVTGLHRELDQADQVCRAK